MFTVTEAARAAVHHEAQAARQLEMAEKFAASDKPRWSESSLASAVEHEAKAVELKALIARVRPATDYQDPKVWDGINTILAADRADDEARRAHWGR
jgi:hypothetical protein